MNKIKYFIIGGMAITLLLILFINKKNKFKELVEKNGILFNLTTNKKVNLIIIIGGISFATPKWMYEQLNENYKNNCLIVIAPYSIGFDFLMEKITDITKEYDYKIKKTAFIGYSAGGHLIQKNYNKDFNFVGLIDPSTAPNYLTQEFSDNVFMLYNDKNWGGYPNIKKTLPLLNEKIISSGGESNAISEGHAKIPLIFFNTYENNLI